MFYKVQSVTPKDNFTLSVLFTDGVKKEYDIKPLFEKWPVFKSLKDIPGLFQQVKVDTGGYGISWSDEIDLEGNELRENGYMSDELPNKETVKAMDELLSGGGASFKGSTHAFISSVADK